MHGSIGSEISGLPYWVFKALPVMYAKRLGPEGYRRFGLLYETPQADLPIGVSRREDVRGRARLVQLFASAMSAPIACPATSGNSRSIGAPSNNLRLQELISFLIDVGRDPGFTADELDRGDRKRRGRRQSQRLRAGGLSAHRFSAECRLAFLDLGEQPRLRRPGRSPGGRDGSTPSTPTKRSSSTFRWSPRTSTRAALNGSSDYPSIWMQRAARGNEPSLGWQQHFGRRAQL